MIFRQSASLPNCWVPGNWAGHCISVRGIPLTKHGLVCLSFFPTRIPKLLVSSRDGPEVDTCTANMLPTARFSSLASQTMHHMCSLRAELKSGGWNHIGQCYDQSEQWTTWCILVVYAVEHCDWLEPGLAPLDQLCQAKIFSATMVRLDFEASVSPSFLKHLPQSHKSATWHHWTFQGL